MFFYRRAHRRQPLGFLAPIAGVENLNGFVARATGRGMVIPPQKKDLRALY
jgi:hypothetical protein